MAKSILKWVRENRSDLYIRRPKRYETKHLSKIVNDRKKLDLQ